MYVASLSLARKRDSSASDSIAVAWTRRLLSAKIGSLIRVDTSTANGKVIYHWGFSAVVTFVGSTDEIMTYMQTQPNSDTRSTSELLMNARKPANVPF